MDQRMGASQQVGSVWSALAGPVANEIDSQSTGVWIVDADGCTSFVNSAVCKMLGYCELEMEGCSIYDFIARPALDGREAGRPKPAAQAIERRELRLVSKSGEPVWVSLEGSPFFDAVGRYQGSFALVRNITERRLAEAKLSLGHMGFQRLADSGIVTIAFADIHGGIHHATDAFLALTGYSHEDIASGQLRWTEMTPKGWEAADAAAVEQLRTTGTAPLYEKEVIRRDGTIVPILIGIAMLDGTNCIAFLADISERKRTEAALRDAREQLAQSQKVEAIGSLAAGVAHDFNNILSLILSYSQLILEDLPADHAIRDDLEQIHLAGRRAAALTGQLLTFSRRETVQPRCVDVADTLIGAEPMLRRLLGEDVSLDVSTQSRGHVLIDPSQVEQLILNLAVNARDAMPAGGRLVCETLDTELSDGEAAALGTTPGEKVELIVRDGGCGMDDATLARIFEPFFTTKAPGRGTGLGLSTVFGIVQQWGGKVVVQSAVGVGTTFRLIFPRASSATSAAVPAPEATRSSVAPRATETVLIVEDDTSLRALLEQILRRAGYRVLTAVSGGDALLVAEQHEGTIDLLFTDVVLPLISGPLLAQRLRAQRSGLRVVYSSGYTSEAVAERGVSAGDVHFLQKPIVPEALLEAMRRALAAPAQ